VGTFVRRHRHGLLRIWEEAGARYSIGLRHRADGFPLFCIERVSNCSHRYCADGLPLFHKILAHGTVHILCAGKTRSQGESVGGRVATFGE
jgi:hypothetical protein